MKKIVDGILFDGQFVVDAWDVRTWRANGVMERSCRQVVEWTEIGPATSPMSWEDYIAQFDYDPAKQKRLEAERLLEIEEKHQRSLKKSAQRAKQMCRRVIISENFDELLTLTYRENQLDRDLCKKHFKEWVRRMKRALPGFRYCASFERQERGSMHVHLATRKLPTHADYKGVKVKAWELGTKVWRSVVGADNGLCHVGAKTRFGSSRRSRLSLSKMASYVSKYIMKDYEDAPESSNRYSRSDGNPVAKPEVMRFSNCSLFDLIVLTFEQGEGDMVVSHRIGHFKDSLWLCTERDISRVVHV